jgi:hypothetical protein
VGNPLNLLMEMTLDSEKAQEGIESFRGVIEGAVSALQGNFSSLTSTMEGTAGVLGGIGAAAGVVGAAMFELANHAAEVGTRIYEASERTGIAADKLSGLMAITTQTGGSFEGLSMALSRAGVNLEKTIEHAGKLNPLLYELMGGAQGAAELGLKPMDERLQEVLKRIFNVNDVAQQHVLLQELMGRGWMHNVEALRLLAEEGYGPAIEKAKQFGLFFDEKAAAQARQFTIEWNSLKAEFHSVALEIGESLIPAFNELFRIMSGFTGLAGISPLEGLKQGFKDFASGMLYIVDQLGPKQVAYFTGQKDYLADYARGLALNTKEIQMMTDAMIAHDSNIHVMVEGHKAMGAALDVEKAARDRAAEAARRHQEHLAWQIEHVQSLTELWRHLTEEMHKQAKAYEELVRAQLDIQLEMRVTKKDIEELNEVIKIQTEQRITPLDFEVHRHGKTIRDLGVDIKQMLQPLGQWEIVLTNQPSLLANVRAAIGEGLRQSWEEHTALRQKAEAIREVAQETGKYTEMQHLEIAALTTLNAIGSKAADRYAAELSSLVELIAGRKAAAYVEAIWDTARAAELWAEVFLGNVAAAPAALQYTIAAAQYWKIATGSAGGAGGGGGGGAAPRAAVTAAGTYAGGPVGERGPGGSYAASTSTVESSRPTR